MKNFGKSIYGELTVPRLVVLVLVNMAIIFYSGRTILNCAKLLTVELNFFLSAVCLLIFFKHRRFLIELSCQERLAEQARDDAMFELTAVRARLNKASTRWQRMPERGRFKVSRLIITHVGSAALMLLQKERSLLKWGFWTARAVKSAFAYFKSL